MWTVVECERRSNVNGGRMWAVVDCMLAKMQAMVECGQWSNVDYDRMWPVIE